MDKVTIKQVKDAINKRVPYCTFKLRWDNKERTNMIGTIENGCYKVWFNGSWICNDAIPSCRAKTIECDTFDELIDTACGILTGEIKGDWAEDKRARNVALRVYEYEKAIRNKDKEISEACKIIASHNYYDKEKLTEKFEQLKIIQAEMRAFAYGAAKALGTSENLFIDLAYDIERGRL